MLYPAANLLDRIRAGAVASWPDGGDGSRATRRLQRWAAQPPFDQPPWWDRRLADAGLTAAGLRHLLAEPAPALAARLPAPPAWLTELRAAFWDHPPGPTANPPGPTGPIGPIGPTSDPFDAPFARLAEPLLARARQRLADRLAALAAGGPAPFDPEQLLGWLYPALSRLVDRLLTRTVVLELNVARVLGALPPGTPAERFEAFRERLGRPDERRRMLTDYPVLGRFLATVTSHWVNAGAMFAGRLAADWPALAAAFGRGGELGQVVGLATGLGDPHRGGQTVLAVTFASGVRIVYKPRPVAPDRHVAQLLEWLAERGLRASPRLPACLDRGDYGWAEYVTAAPCTGGEALHLFYRRHGVLLAVLYLLRANDLSADNVIAAGDQPVPVDLEAICQPELALAPDGVLAAEQAAMAAAASSVLRVGLLPLRTWRTATGASADLSGLGGEPGQLNPIALPELAGAGTDRMRLELRRRPLSAATNLPVADGSPLRILDYVDDIVAGFTETYELSRRHRDELLAAAGPLAAFRGDQVRVILRSTAEYALLRDTGHHPDVLRDALDTDRHFDRLWRGVPRRPALAACVEAERSDLWQQDIPMFTARTDEQVLRASDGTPIAGLVRRSGMASVREAVAGLGPADLARQRWLIRTSLAAQTMDLREIEYPSYPLPATRTRPGADRLIAGAEAIGRHLAEIAYRAPGSAQWLGMVSHRGQDWSLGPLGPDLCTGLSGVALFLGLLGRLTGEPEHSALARAALATARSQVDRGALPKAGGSAGLGGIVYAFTQLGLAWGDGELLDYATSLAVLSGRWAVEDEQFDFTSGSAGSIAALRVLYAVCPRAQVQEAIHACAERLLVTQQPVGPGAAWLPRLMREGRVADVPLAGFAHGVAGIAWPLLEAAAICGEQRYSDAAAAAIAYERSLFVPAAGTWRDHRHAAAGAPFDFSGWCHGAAGIGLARVRCLPHLAGGAISEEIRAAVRHTRHAGFGMNHSLCHGDLGNLDLLVLAAGALGEPSWLDEAEGLLGAITDSIDEHGWISGAPHGVETPGLLLGLAGTGYGLLRMAAPDRVPSVLTLDPLPGIGKGETHAGG